MWWTIEQTAEHVGMTIEQVYETRRRKEWPGILGIRQGRRLRFDSERVEAGPVMPEHTDDAAVATVWLLEDIRNLLHTAIDELRAWQREATPWQQDRHYMTTSPGETGDEERADDE